MANDFSDAACVAVYNFESGALGADSKGDNDLTVTGVAEDTTNYKQGACAADFELADSDEMQRVDAVLSADFPLKDGTTNQTIYVSCWVKPETVSGSYYNTLWAKGACHVYYAYGGFYFALKTAGDTQIISLALTVTAGQWYFVAAAFDSATDVSYLRVWDETGVMQYRAYYSTATASLDVNADSFYVGRPLTPITSKRRMDGLLDEMVVFNRYVTEDESDLIRQGLYASSSSSSSLSFSSSSSSSLSSSSSDSSSSSFVPRAWPSLSKGVEFDAQELPGAHDVTMPLGNGQVKIRPRYTRRPHRWRIRLRLLTLTDRLTLERFYLGDCRRSQYTFEFLEQGMNQTWLVRWDPDEPVRFEHEERCPGQFRCTGVLLEDCAGEYGSGKYGEQYYDS